MDGGRDWIGFGFVADPPQGGGGRGEKFFALRRFIQSSVVFRRKGEKFFAPTQSMYRA
jgi:hypothetical protein